MEDANSTHRAGQDEVERDLEEEPANVDLRKRDASELTA